jgi:fucose permease
MFIPVYLTSFSETFGGLSEAELGRIPALLFAAALGGTVVCGPLADRIGAKMFAVIGPIVVAFGLVGMAAAPSFPVFLLGAAMAGLGAGILDTILSPIVAAANSHNRAPALNSLHAFYCLGAVAITLGSAFAIYLHIHWRTVALGLALLPVAVSVAFLITKVPPLLHPEVTRHSARKLLLTPMFYAAVALIVFAGATEEGMAQWLPAYAERELGFSRSVAGASLSVFMLLMGIGRFGGARIVRNYGARAALIAAGSCCCVLYVAGSQFPSPYVALTACVAVGLACSIMWPTTLGMTADRIPLGGASMYAVLSAAGSAGNLATPWLEGQIAERTSLSTALFVAAAFPLLLALIAASSRRPVREAGA